MRKSLGYSALLRDLFKRHTSEIKLDLSRVTRLSACVGNPHLQLKAIHVAGSNGKGSVCTMIHSMLCAQGYKVGLYTSPHLEKFNERIRINNAFIPNRDVARIYRMLLPHIKDETFFEITTVMAFVYFKEERCDYAVIEVGLGGRLDATNILTPIICAITSISLEHTNILGTTLKEIAREKAGIIKTGIPILTSAKGEALQEIKRIAKQKQAPFVSLLSISTSKKTKKKPGKGTSFSIGDYRNLALGTMRGEFQLQNAQLAVSLLHELKLGGVSLSQKSIAKGLKDAYWPARMEYASHNVLIDCAHNIDGAKNLAKELSKIPRKKIMVIGILKDKDYSAMMRTLSAHASHVILTSVPNERSARPSDLAKFCSSNHVQIGDNKKALAHAKSLAQSGELIVITGSIYLIGALMPSIRLLAKNYSQNQKIKSQF